MSRATRPLQWVDALGHTLPYSASDSKLKIVYSTNTIRYYGLSRPGAGITDAAWRVYRETVNGSGDTTAIDFAEGLNDFNNVWDDSVATPINAITQANPGQVTTTAAHGYSTGDIIDIEDVSGMVEANDGYFTITVVDATKYTIGVDTSGYGAYTSGGNGYKRDYANYTYA